MAYTTINKSTANFNTKLYTGNAGTNAQTGVGFQPDWVWLKQRSGSAASHKLYDSVRGTTKYIASNNTGAEATDSNGLTAFGTDGFTVGSSAGTNANNETYVSWNWKAGTSFSNSAGANGASLASTGSVNTTAGFSIIKWTNSTSNVATIAHGLGVKPSLIILKTTTGTYDWTVYTSSVGEESRLILNSTSSTEGGGSFFNNTNPTTSVFTTGSAGQNTNNTIVAYCFADKQGYSKIGKYTGNGNADGTFVYTGFKPAFILVKRTNGSENWTIMDSARDPSNVAVNKLHPNTTGGTDAGATIDILSNGFKNRTTNAGANGSGNTYIYMAFGQTLVGTNNIPNNAF